MPMDWEKWQKKRETQAPPDLDKVVDNFKRFRGRMPNFYLLILVAVVGWILSGIFIVAPDEAGVVKRFGAYNRTAGSGPHYHLPYPIESVQKPKVTQIQRFEVGFRTINPGPPPQYRPVSDESLMLTGDENIIDIQFIVQYRIRNATDYLFKIADPGKTIRDAAEAAMRQVVGKNKIDETLTVGKFRIQEDTQRMLQEILDKYESGLEVSAVQLQAVHPPEQVRDAFKDVVSAREEKNKFINEAQGYANDILPKAKGQAAQMVKQAEAYKEEKIKRSQGDSARFLSQLKEYRKAKDVTRKRLYLETMEDVIQRGDKYIIDSETRNILPLLQLQKDQGGEEKPKPEKQG